MRNERDGARALVVGLDGIRLDTLRDTATPALDAVAAAGVLRPASVHPAAPTLSGPGWVTIATGMTADAHRVRDNGLAGMVRQPDFLTRVRTARPDATCYAASSWPPLVRAGDGGPVFAGGGYTPGGVVCGEPETWDAADERVTGHAERTLVDLDVTAAFLYLGLADEVAHAAGTGAEYRDAIGRTDARLGRVLAAAASQPGSLTVIVVTDHGQVEGGGHGGDSADERTAWIAAAGPGLGPGVPDELAQVDVHPQVLAGLGVPVEDEWRLAGRPFAR